MRTNVVNNDRDIRSMLLCSRLRYNNYIYMYISTYTYISTRSTYVSRTIRIDSCNLHHLYNRKLTRLWMIEYSGGIVER